MRTLLFLILFLIPQLAMAQDQDDGLLWIALRLIDSDQVEHPIIQDNWTVPCSNSEQTNLLPHGFELETATRELPKGLCERTLDVRVSGWINDQFVTRKQLTWQPGENGSRMIGIPREMTTRIKITLPELIETNDRIFHATEPIVLRPTGVERVVVVEAPLRRLTTVTMSGTETDLNYMFGKHVIQSESGRLFLLPEVESVRAPNGYLVDVRVRDRSGAVRQVTPAIRPGSYAELIAAYGWEYHIEIVPKKPTRVAKRGN